MAVLVPQAPTEWAAALAALAAPPPAWGGLAGPGPWVMGILNVTPDSFSDGGLHADGAAAVAAGLRMAEAGADIIDVGGESTRPGAAAISPGEEQARVLPVIAALAAQGLRVSVDTRNAATMAAALQAGATIVNDISGLAFDPGAAPLLAARNCDVVLMHMRGDPATMDSLARYGDVAAEVTHELAKSIAVAQAAGIAPARIAVDPGIGFAKTAAHNLALLDRLPLLHSLGRRILVGVSRKSFLGRLTGEALASARDPASVAAGLHALGRGATLLRVHDVRGTAQAIRVWRELYAVM
jgi:dihydropteroate synthase